MVWNERPDIQRILNADGYLDFVMAILDFAEDLVIVAHLMGKDELAELMWHIHEHPKAENVLTGGGKKWRS